MAKITKQSLIDMRQAIIDVDEELRARGESYTHGSTATEAVEYDLAVARLQNKRNKLTNEYQVALSRAAAALDNADAAGEAGE